MTQIVFLRGRVELSGGLTQGFMLTKQALYHLPVHFALVTLEIAVS
jgi:hypothetical protein